MQAGFSIADVFAEDAENIPHYLMKGFSEKFELDLWEGFHKIMLGTFEKMQEGDQASAMLFKMFAPVMPMYLLQMKGKLDVDVDPEDIAALMSLPQAEMAQANLHSLLSSMTSWGTLDDMELIQMTENETNEYVLPIWNGVPGHENFENTMDAVEGFLAFVTPLFKQDFFTEEAKQSFGEKMDAMGRRAETRIFPHFVSLLLGDHIEIEGGARISPHLEYY